MDSSIPLHMAAARDELRQTLGIRTGTPSQLVVNTLLALNLDLQTGNQPAAITVLGGPIFTLPPEQTLHILSNLPYNQQANLATSRAEDEELPVGGARS